MKGHCCRGAEDRKWKGKDGRAKGSDRVDGRMQKGGGEGEGEGKRHGGEGRGGWDGIGCGGGEEGGKLWLKLS